MYSFGRHIDTAEDSPWYEAVVYSHNFKVSDRVTLHFLLYFPSIPHSNTHGGSRSPVTMAQIAGMNMLESRAKWHSWYQQSIGRIASGFVENINTKLEVAASGATEKWKRERERSFKKTESRAKISSIKKEIDRLIGQREKISQKYGKMNKMPDFSWIDDRDDLSEKKKSSLEKSLKTKWSESRSLYISKGRRIGDLKTLLKETREEIYREHVSPAIRDLHAKLVSLERSGEIYKSRDYRLIEDEIEIAMNPLHLASAIKAAIEKEGENVRQYFVEALLGAKSPDLSPKTVSNRKWRGNPTEPPLNETGEFANSLEYKVF